jgi:two-component system, OmpR family, response regulator
MNEEHRIKLFLVDDDLVFLRMLEIELLGHADFAISTFTSGERCLEALHENPDIIILDYLLDGADKSAMNGLETLKNIKIFSPQTEIIVLSAQDEIDVAVNCMHNKAYDYVVKSETAFIRLQSNISKILSTKKMEKQVLWYRNRM